MKVKYYLVLLTAAAMHLTGCYIFYPIGRIESYETFEDNKGTGELSASYGRISGIQVWNAAGNDLDLHYTGSNSAGNFFLTYHYYVSDRVCLGTSIGTQVLNYNWLDDNSGVAYKEKMTMPPGRWSLNALHRIIAMRSFTG